MRIKKITAVLAGVLSLAVAFSPIAAMADTAAPFVSLGADLNASQRATVLQLLGVTEDELTEDNTITVTNADEHEYLDGKVEAAMIGTRALSSCKVTEAAEGSGINVTTYNITYVTAEMYENALATAGMENAEVIVAGPTNISGTAALVGAMEAYAKMNGQVIEPTVIESATDELVTTGQIAENTGDSEKAAELVAALKQIVAEQDLTEPQEIGEAVDDVSNQLEISLSAEDRQLLIELLQKLGELDLDTKALAEQAQGIYERLQSSGIDLSEYGINTDEAKNLLQRIIDWIRSLFQS